MTARAALADLPVLQRRAAKADEQPRVVADTVIAGGTVQKGPETAQDMRHHRLGRGKTVGELRPREPTDRVQEPLQLTLGVVKSPGAGPAIGAAKDRAVAEGPSHPVQLAGHQLVDLLPTDLDIGIDAAPFGMRARPTLQPAFADHV